MKHNKNIILLIIIILIILLIFRLFRIEKFTLKQDHIITNDLTVSDSILIGKDKEFKYPTHNIDASGKLISNELCVNENQNDTNCFNKKDLDSLKRNPHFFKNNIKLGGTTVTEQDFKDINNVDGLIQEYYKGVCNQAMHLALPLSNGWGARWIPGDGGWWDDYIYRSANVVYNQWGGKSEQANYNKVPSLVHIQFTR